MTADRSNGRQRRLRVVAAKSTRWLVSTALGAAIALGVASALGQLGHAPPTESQQLDDVLHDAETHGLLPVYNREVDLHGSGSLSRLIVFRPRFKSIYRRSDEVRVYDELDDRLQLAFTVRPIHAANASHRPDYGATYRIDLLAIGKLDRSDRTEAAFVLTPTYADTDLARPVVLTWDASEQSYRVRALLRYPVRLPRAVGAWAKGAHRLYRPIAIQLAGGGTLTSVGGTERISLARGRMATAYVVRQACNACNGTWRFDTTCLDFTYPELSGLDTTAAEARVGGRQDVARYLARALRTKDVGCR